MTSRSKFKDLDRYFGSLKTNEITLTLGNEISKAHRINYPEMKILDMAFWQLGFDYK